MIDANHVFVFFDIACHALILMFVCVGRAIFTHTPMGDGLQLAQTCKHAAISFKDVHECLHL
jgi:hypothetical protein